MVMKLIVHFSHLDLAVVTDGQIFVTECYIADNGSGMAKDDMVIAFERHATSKIRRTEDLNVISSFGFRGEALASIASVAEVEVTSRTKDSDTGYRVVIKGGNLVSEEEVAAQIGTTFTVRNLFYNTPARLKHLGSTYQELSNITDYFYKSALYLQILSV